MNDRANDEKLRILQERLSQIKQKDETLVPPIDQREKVIEVPFPQTETPQKKKTLISFGWLKYVVIIGALGYGSFYVYNNIDNISSSSDKGIENTKEFVLEYNLNMPGKKIAITTSFKEEFLAKAMVNDLKVKGYKCDYFFLPEKSTSTEEIFKVFIGPYETEEEINQWTHHLEGDFEIIKQ